MQQYLTMRQLNQQSKIKKWMKTNQRNTRIIMKAQHIFSSLIENQLLSDVYRFIMGPDRFSAFVMFLSI